jgi:hypothetical protein
LVANDRPEVVPVIKQKLQMLIQNHRRNLISSEYQLSSLLKKKCGLVPAVPVELGIRFTEKKDHGQQTILEVPAEAMVVPFVPTLEKLLLNNELRSYIENPFPPNKDGYYETVKDGTFWQQNKICQTFKDCLLVQLYEDDVENCNPLGANTKKHKTTNIYWTLLNFPEYVRANLKSINLAAIARSEDICEFGFCTVLEDFIMGVNQLQSDNGLEINLNGVKKIVHGVLVTLNGDGLALNTIGGFKASFAFASRPCRTCNISQEEIALIVFEGKVALRDMETHKCHLEALENAKTVAERNEISRDCGVKDESVLAKFDNFDYCKNLPQDLMHNGLEGVAEIDIKNLLRKFIFEDKCLSIEQFNEELMTFPYPSQFLADKPSVIDKGHILDANLRQSASQVITLLYVLPFILAPYVTKDNVMHLENFVLLCQTINILLAYKIRKSSTSKLRFMLQVHKMQFEELYKEAPITPKTHFFLHSVLEIEKFGPSRVTWCMRYESRNAWFKQIAQRSKNKKNICKTLATRGQIRSCLDLGLGNPEAIILGGNTFNPTISSSIDLRQYHLGREVAFELGVDFTSPRVMSHAASSIYLKNSEVAQKTLILLEEKTLDTFPKFGRVCAIFVSNGECVFVVNIIDIVEFDDLRNAYHFEDSQSVCCVNSSKLLSTHPLPELLLHGKKYVSSLYLDINEFLG